MEKLTAIIRAVCVVSVGIALVEGLTEGSVLKRQMKFLLSLCFITVLLVPFVQGGVGFSISDAQDFFDSSQYETSSQAYSQSLEEQISENISAILLEEIRLAGAECKKLVLDVNISETNSIDINRVVIKDSEVRSEDKAVIEKIIQENLGNVVVEYG